MLYAVSARFSSLTGYWSGYYGYPTETLEPVPFNASLEERDGVIVGETDEPVTALLEARGPRLLADITGERAGFSVRFVKSLLGPEGANHDIIYEGTVLEGFSRIEGLWTIPGEWSGPFFMERIDQAMAQASAEAAENRL
jgi:hypothetical protein